MMVVMKSKFLLLLGVLGCFAPAFIDASNGCCSLNYKTCINWCGKTKKSCGKCNHKNGVAWLENGSQQTCNKRWAECESSQDSCCDGLVCRENKNNVKVCLLPKKNSIKTNESPAKPPDSKSTPSSGESNDKGCCTLDFVSCIDWCGPTEDSCLNCNHHDGVGWMKNGPPTDQCLSRWTGCGNNRNGCCDGLVCQPDANNYLMCLPSFLIESTPTDSPTISPTSSPTLSPTKAPAKPCCSLDFKNCIDWCGPSYDTCSNCNHHDGVGWLYNGAPKDNMCLNRWTGCGHNPEGCCDGMVCKEDDNNYLMCLPKNLIGTKSPTSEPTSKPTSMSTNEPTIAVVVSTDEPTTLSPTFSTTTNNPTAKETEPSTTFSPTAKTTTLSGVPTDTPTASPTEYPTFHPTQLTSEPTSADTTFEPTSADTTFEPTASNLCMDDPELLFKDDTTKDCSWVRKKPDNRCERKWNGKKLVDYCPVSCGVCPPTDLLFLRKLLRGQN